MSFGEVVNLYQDKDLVINPEFQRLFRWTNFQKSRLIESILLGIPIPPIFVYERTDGKWELVDGLQRISTVLEFMGVLRDAEADEADDPLSPSILSPTNYLPSLNNAVWERSDRIKGYALKDQIEIGKVLQLSIRRSRIGVEILKRSSDAHTKYDLFQRLNSGGSIANAQELRNCIAVMVNPLLFGSPAVTIFQLERVLPAERILYHAAAHDTNSVQSPRPNCLLNQRHQLRRGPASECRSRRSVKQI